MGSAVSGETAVRLDEEIKLPLNASDVDTPRGESAKQEVRRLRLFLAEKYYEEQQPVAAPSLQAYLEREFALADVDGSGVLSSDEFWYMIREHLQLGLSDEDIAFLQSNGDLDQDGTVSWSEFIGMAPTLLQAMMRISDASHRDWCTFTIDDGTPYYFNKRTNETYWDKPGDMMVEEAQGTFSSMAPGGPKRMNTQLLGPDLRECIASEGGPFETYDALTPASSVEVRPFCFCLFERYDARALHFSSSTSPSLAATRFLRKLEV
jgi:hypothetical protein